MSWDLVPRSTCPQTGVVREMCAYRWWLESVCVQVVVREVCADRWWLERCVRTGGG